MTNTSTMPARASGSMTGVRALSSRSNAVASAGHHPDRSRRLVGPHLFIEVADGAVDALCERPQAAAVAATKRDHLALD